MPKTIIICCDGTGQEFSDNMTNVLRLANVLRQTGEQHVFYDPGVGTLPRRSVFPPPQNGGAWRCSWGLATG